MTEFIACQRPGLRFEKLGGNEPADFSLHRDGRIVGFVEIKTRTSRHDDYGTYMLSKHKLVRLAALGHLHHTKTAVVVRWSDKLGFINAQRFLDHATFEQGGRWDRGDGADVEAVAHIPVDQFTFVKPNPVMG